MSKSFRVPSLDRLKKKCDDWNASHPVGTAVDYSPGIGGNKIVQTKTRSAAYVLSGHAPVVFVDGVSGCVALEAVKVRTAA